MAGAREKLAQEGGQALKNSELLAIIFNVGNRSENVWSLANRAVKDYNLDYLSQADDYRSLQESLRLPPLKAMQLFAVLELGRRIYGRDNRDLHLNTPHKIAQYLSWLEHKDQEELWIVSCNDRLQPLSQSLLAVGSQNVVYSSVRDILSLTLLQRATAFFIAHNHPSGDPQPSEADSEFTLKLRKAAELVGLNLIDHLIVSRTGYYSFAANVADWPR